MFGFLSCFILHPGKYNIKMLISPRIIIYLVYNDRIEDTYMYQRVMEVMSTSPKRNMFWNSKKSTMVIWLPRVWKSSHRYRAVGPNPKFMGPYVPTVESLHFIRDALYSPIRKEWFSKLIVFRSIWQIWYVASHCQRHHFLCPFVLLFSSFLVLTSNLPHLCPLFFVTTYHLWHLVDLIFWRCRRWRWRRTCRWRCRIF